MPRFNISHKPNSKPQITNTREKMTINTIGHVKKLEHNSFEPSIRGTISTAESRIALTMDYSNLYYTKSENIKSEMSEITHIHMMPDHKILIMRDTMATES